MSGDALPAAPLPPVPRACASGIVARSCTQLTYVVEGWGMQGRRKHAKVCFKRAGHVGFPFCLLPVL